MPRPGNKKNNNQPLFDEAKVQAFKQQYIALLPANYKEKGADLSGFAQSLLSIWADNPENEEAKEAFHEFLTEQFGEPKKDGKPDAERIISEEQWNFAENFNIAMTKASVQMMTEASLEIERNKQRVKDNNMIPSIEYYSQKEATSLQNKLAHNLFILEHPDKHQKLRHYAVYQNAFYMHLYNAKYKTEVEPQAGEPENENFIDLGEKEMKETASAKRCRDGFNEQTTKVRNDFFDKVYPQYKDRAGELTSHDVFADFSLKGMNGYKLKQNWQQGDPLFTDIPKELKELNEAKPEELEERKRAQDKILNGCKKYEENILKLREEAEPINEEFQQVIADAGLEQLITDLKQGRTVGKLPKDIIDLEDSYITLKDSMENLTKIGIGMKPSPGPNGINEKTKAISPDIIEKSIINLSIASKELMESGYIKNAAFAKMAKRLQNFSEVALSEYDHQKYGINKASTAMQRKSVKQQLAKLEIARKKHNMAEFEDRRADAPTPLTDLLDQATEKTNRAKIGVHMGSGEYDTASKSFEKIKKQYLKFQQLMQTANPDKAKLQEAVAKVYKEIEQSRKDIAKYMKRKQKKGQLQNGASKDLKSQKRIVALKRGLETLNQVTDLLDLDAAGYMPEDREVEINKKYREQHKKITSFDAEADSKRKESPYMAAAANQAGMAYTMSSAIFLRKDPKFDDEEQCQRFREHLAAVVFLDTLKNEVDPKTMDALNKLPNAKEKCEQAIQNLANSAEFKDMTRNLNPRNLKHYLANPSRLRKQLVSMSKEEMENKFSKEGIVKEEKKPAMGKK